MCSVGGDAVSSIWAFVSVGKIFPSGSSFKTYCAMSCPGGDTGSIIFLALRNDLVLFCWWTLKFQDCHEFGPLD
jgi:hypothetical protein